LSTAARIAEVSSLAAVFSSRTAWAGADTVT